PAKWVAVFACASLPAPYFDAGTGNGTDDRHMVLLPADFSGDSPAAVVPKAALANPLDSHILGSAIPSVRPIGPARDCRHGGMGVGIQPVMGAPDIPVPVEHSGNPCRHVRPHPTARKQAPSSGKTFSRLFHFQRLSGRLPHRGARRNGRGSSPRQT